MSKLTNNTAELNKILAAVNALPEAGGGGINPTGEIEITENGTYDVTNYATAEVNVPSKEPVLQEGSATPTKSQQTVEPSSGVDGFSKFVVEKIPDQYIIPEGTAEITKNGEHDVIGYAKVDVNVPDIPAVTEELRVTENGTWEPGTGVDGFSKVVVNVPDVPAVVQPLEVTENGTYTPSGDVDGYGPVVVNVPSEESVTEELNITKNGIYEPEDGVDGFSKVTVNVPSSGGSSDAEISLLTREITTYSNPTLDKLGAYAVSGTDLSLLNLPALTSIDEYAFYECNKLPSVDFPLLTAVPHNGFREAKGLVKADLGPLESIGSNGFYQCTKLEALIIRTNKLCVLSSSTVFTGTPIENGSGYIYFYRNQVDAHKAATNWAKYADQIRAIEDFPEITGQLPKGWTRVGHIRFTGKQIVDTGIIPDYNTRIEVVFTRESSENKYLYGVRNSTNTASVTAYLGSNTAWRFGNTLKNLTISVGTQCVAEVNRTGVTINGSKYAYSGTVANFTANATLTIGSARATDGALGEPQFVGTASSFRMYSGDEIVLDLVPCCNANGEYAFFDMVSGTFKMSVTDTPLQGG